MVTEEEIQDMLLAEEIGRLIKEGVVDVEYDEEEGDYRLYPGG